MESHKRITAYVITQGDSHADAKKVRSEEVLRKMRAEVGKEIEWHKVRRPGSVSQEAVLFTYLRKLEGRCEERDAPLARKEASEGCLRGMRTSEEPRGSSHRSGRNEQPPRERADALQVLSRLLARHSQEAWEIYSRQNASALLNVWGKGWEDGVPRVAHGVPARVDRLRCLGNAVVPQVVELIGRAIMEHECGERIVGSE
jgi:site-specific DNA-cytosine methylase